MPDATSNIQGCLATVRQLIGEGANDRQFVDFVLSVPTIQLEGVIGTATLEEIATLQPHLMQALRETKADLERQRAMIEDLTSQVKHHPATSLPAAHCD